MGRFSNNYWLKPPVTCKLLSPASKHGSLDMKSTITGHGTVSGQ